MKVVVICSVRSGTKDEVYKYVDRLESEGHNVYFPPRDTPQDDPTGYNICLRMKQAISQADEVHIFYYPDSQGVHFDIGMAFMLGKKWKLLNNPIDDNEKSYIKVIKETE